MKSTPFLHIFSYILHNLSASEAFRVKNIILCTLKTILICLNQFLLEICGIISNQLLHFLSNVFICEFDLIFKKCFLDICTSFQHLMHSGSKYDYFVPLNLFYFSLINSYQKYVQLQANNYFISLVEAVSMKMTPFL